MARKLIIIGLIITAIAVVAGSVTAPAPNGAATQNLTDNINGGEEGVLEAGPNPLSIETLRNGEYPGSDIVIEQTLAQGANYKKYVASYKSEGLKIYALLTVPNGTKPASGWPVIVFNHGYIPPAQYKTTERYVAYVDGFARAGYIVLKPDFRGHGDSEGEATGGYGSNAYTVDALNAVASIKKYADADPARIGMWGHSMGGHVTLRAMVASTDIKAGVIWAGVVGSYPDLINNWRRRPTAIPPTIPAGARRWRQELQERYGTPEQNPSFWESLSANTYLADISGPLQLHHGTADESVPLALSQTLEQQMKTAGKEAELYTYQNDNHNLSQSFTAAMRRSVAFFDEYVKNK